MLSVALQVCAVAAALLAFARADGQSKDCDPMKVIKCGLNVKSGNLLDELWPEDGQYLDELCDGDLPGYRCMRDYFQRCPLAVVSERQKTYYEAQLRLLEKLCDENDNLRKSFLKHAKCVNEHREETEGKCGPLTRYLDPKHRISQNCDQYDDVLNCNYQETEKNCQSEAVDTIKELVGPIRKYVKGNCNNQ